MFLLNTSRNLEKGIQKSSEDNFSSLDISRAILQVVSAGNYLKIPAKSFSRSFSGFFFFQYFDNSFHRRLLRDYFSVYFFRKFSVFFYSNFFENFQCFFFYSKIFSRATYRGFSRNSCRCSLENFGRKLLIVLL